MMPNKLPAGFEDLERFVPEWTLATEQERFVKLHAVPHAELAAFYEAVLPRLPAMMDYLKHHRLSAMPPDAKRLYDLALTMVETSHPMDLKWGDTDFPGAYRWQAIEFQSVSRASRATVVE
jgi:hypothetical protein